MTRRTSTLQFHTCGPTRRLLPHDAEHRSEHRTLREAVEAAPRDRNSYVNWPPADGRPGYVVSGGKAERYEKKGGR